MTGRARLHLDDSRQQIDAALTRQCEIEQQQIVLVARQQIETGVAVGCHHDAEAFKRQQRLERLSDSSLVVDDQYAGPGV